MTYNQRVINDRPAYFYPLNEGSLAFSDYMGATSTVVIGSPVPSPPLVVGGGNAYVFNGNDNFRFASRLFGPDSVQVPFSLEAWFKPVRVDGGYKGIIGHMGTNDGLGFDGEQIYFITDHGAAGTAVASFFPSSTTGTFHVVGVHTGSKNELYVNGVRVAAVDLTDAQRVTPYANSVDGVLYVGHYPGSIIVDSVAVYAEALTGRTVAKHFFWGRDTSDFKSVVTTRGGTYWSFTDDTVRIALDFKFDTDEEWFSGQTTSISRENNRLLPAFDENGLTREGNWQAGIILSAVADVLDGSKIEWDSDGAVRVQTSLNGGVSWSDAVNGREVPGIGQNYSTANQSLEVRVIFPAGETVDTITNMRSLSIKLYESRRAPSNVSGREATFSGNFALANQEHQPIEHEDRTGVNLYSASASVKSDSARTVEMWVHLDETAGVDESILDARPGSNAYLKYSGAQWSTSSETVLYVNGEQKAGAAINIFPGRWTHLVFILPTATVEPIVLGDRNLAMRVGMYANYNYTMTEQEVKSLYNAYLGIASVSVGENSGLRIADLGGDEVKIYAYAWTLQASG